MSRCDKPAATNSEVESGQEGEGQLSPPQAEHLENVAELAAEFAKIFSGENWAEIAGNNHGLGKGVKDWQAYLRRANQIVDDFAVDYDGHPNHAQENHSCGD